MKLDVKSFHASDMLRGMAKNPKTKRPADVVGNAVRVMQIATGDAEEEEKDPDAIARGKKGGKVRASKLSARKRREIAKKAAEARWAKEHAKDN